jgi:hypothetical protein
MHENVLDFYMKLNMHCIVLSSEFVSTVYMKLTMHCITLFCQWLPYQNSNDCSSVSVD